MRDLIVTEFVSLDGVMEAPGGEAGYPHAGWVGGWFSDELGSYKQEEQLAADVLLLGRLTYDSFYGAWPERDGAMADKINTMRKLVASTSVANASHVDSSSALTVNISRDGSSAARRRSRPRATSRARARAAPPSPGTRASRFRGSAGTPAG